MKHRKATVGMIGACMLWVALAGGARATPIYAEGTADQIEGADNFGATFVHYAQVLGLPVLSLGLMAGGAMRVKANAGQGGAGIATGVGVGYLSSIVSGLHTGADAAVSLGGLASGPGWPVLTLHLVLQAAVVASLVCAARRRAPCGNGVDQSMMNQSRYLCGNGKNLRWDSPCSGEANS